MNYLVAMQLFRKHLRPAWTFRSGKKVWRLLPSQGVLALELRDTEIKETEFAGLDVDTGSTMWRGLQFEEKWWISVSRMQHGILLLQQFVRPDMPTPGKMFAVDAATGKLLWQNDELSFVNFIEDTVYGLRNTFTSEDVIGLNCRTGVPTVTFPSDDPRAGEIASASFDEEYSLPIALEEFDARPSSGIPVTFPSGAKTPSVIESPPDRRVIGYHVDGGTDGKGVPVYESHLNVIDNSGKILFEDVADRGVYTTLQDFYFVVSGRLLYVRNSNEIVAVNLG